METSISISHCWFSLAAKLSNFRTSMEASISIPYCFTSWFKSNKVVRPNHLKIVALSVKFMKSLHLAGMAQSPKWRELSLKKKVQLIKESKGKSQRALAEIFKVGKTQVQQILKRKAEYMTAFEENSPSEKKRICPTTEHHNIDEMTWKWFQRTRTVTIPVSGPMIQAKAISACIFVRIDIWKIRSEKSDNYIQWNPT